MALYVQESGNAAAPSILFLHGGGGGGWVWRPQVEKLRDYHCIVPDLPEQGLSANEKPFKIKDSAGRIAELIQKRANDGKAHVVGISEGAQIAITLLSIAPDLVDHAIISSASVRPVFGLSFVTPIMISLLYRLMVQPLKGSDRWMRYNMRNAAGIPEIYYPEFSQAFRNLTAKAFANIMVENQRFCLPPGLENVKAPTLVVVGKNEHKVIRESARDIAMAIPGAEAYKVVHTRKLSLPQEHNWNMTAPKLFTQTVRAWITDQALPNALKLL